MATDPGRAARLRGLYAVTPETTDTARLERLAAASLEGGAAILQYRAKRVPAGLALAQARALGALCRAHGATFIVNDSLPLAIAVGADGVHLGREDEDPRSARIAFPSGVIGVSCYDDPQRGRAAAAAGADYVAIGSVFASPTKPAAVRAPLSALGEARLLSGLPVAAIGGITLENAAQAIEAGADMLAVISAVYDAPDVRRAAQSFAALFASCPGRDVRAQSRTL